MSATYTSDLARLEVVCACCAAAWAPRFASSPTLANDAASLVDAIIRLHQPHGA